MMLILVCRFAAKSEQNNDSSELSGIIDGYGYMLSEWVPGRNHPLVCATALDTPCWDGRWRVTEYGQQEPGECRGGGGWGGTEQVT